MARRALTLSLLAVVLTLAACGGSGGLTKEQYAAKVSGLCLASADAIRELHLPSMVAAYQEYAKILHIDVHFNHALAALDPPTSIASEAAAFVAANKKVLADDRAAYAAAKAGNRLSFLLQLSNANRDNIATYAPAKAIGATGCYIA